MLWVGIARNALIAICHQNLTRILRVHNDSHFSNGRIMIHPTENWMSSAFGCEVFTYNWPVLVPFKILNGTATIL